MQSAEEGDAVRLRSTAVGRDRRDASVEAGGGGGSVALRLKAMAGRRRRSSQGCRFCLEVPRVKTSACEDGRQDAVGTRGGSAPCRLQAATELKDREGQDRLSLFALAGCNLGEGPGLQLRAWCGARRGSAYVDATPPSAGEFLTREDTETAEQMSSQLRLAVRAVTCLQCLKNPLMPAEKLRDDVWQGMDETDVAIDGLHERLEHLGQKRVAGASDQQGVEGDVGAGQSIGG